ncbi:MAG: DnaJ domain-containing protein [Chloroflexota bacterium]
MQTSTGYLDNYYARLGVPLNASAEDIRSAYHKAARKLHPDTNSDPTATELFLQIQEAYENLSDPNKRLLYNATLPGDINPPSEIYVNPLYSRSLLPRIDDTQLVYVLLNMMVSDNYGGEGDEPKVEPASPALNLCVVVDNSTSMAGSRLDVVKSSITYLLRELNPQDILSIVTFNDRAEVIIPAAKGLDYHSLESRISQLQTGGGTEMFHGLDTGFREISKNLSSSYVNQIILITDGRTYGDEDKCLDLVKKASKKGVTISALGIGSEWNDEFVDKLSALTGGNSTYAEKPKDVLSFFEAKLERLSTTYADKVTLELNTGKYSNLRYAFRLSPDPSPLPTDTEINLGYIPIGPSLSVVLEFAVDKLPPEAEIITLVEGSIKIDIPTRAIPTSISKFSFSRPVGIDDQVEPPPQALIKAMSRLSLYRLQEQARQELANGEVEKATTKLQNLATQLLLTGEPELAHTVMLELKQVETGSLISSEAEKRIKYGTRALLLPAGENNKSR